MLPTISGFPLGKEAVELKPLRPVCVGTTTKEHRSQLPTQGFASPGALRVGPALSIPHARLTPLLGGLEPHRHLFSLGGDAHAELSQARALSLEQ